MESFFNGYGVLVAGLAGLAATMSNCNTAMSVIISLLTIIYLGVSIFIKLRKVLRRFEKDDENEG